MKLVLESTSATADLDATGWNPSVRARVWIGKTEDGTPVVAYISRIAVERSADQAAFERELVAHPHTRAADPGIPLRLVL